MASAFALKSICAVLFLGYYVALYHGRDSLCDEQVKFCQFSLVLSVLSTTALATLLPYASLSTLLLLALGAATLEAARRRPELRFLQLAGHGLLVYALWCGLSVWTVNDPYWFLLPLAATLFSVYSYKAQVSQIEWFYSALL